MSKRSERNNYPCQYSDYELHRPYFNDRSLQNKKLDCFIATVVYGDINAPEVQVLRDFRDNVLEESRIGRTAINLYYSGLGERSANFIKDHVPSLVPVIKMGLDYIVDMYPPQK